MASHVVVKKEKALIQWIKPYSFTLEPDIIKNKEIVRTGPVKSRPTGFEPVTYGLEIRCSIQLSYGRKSKKSGREDSNLRPHGPKPCALTGLSYAPRKG